ncbi:MAG TPA: N-acyl homoserine lactonase family protein [Acidimicrobiales bacterium]|nr:N-acyl homoserine lactonase family protein [Acidimicrobiales bacterium]
MRDATVARLDYGYFVRPPDEAGPEPSPRPCLGYLVDHPEARLLVDTGMGTDPEVDAYYRLHRIELPDALARLGLRLDDVDAVANCHLHFDHCGGNPLLSGRPIFVQRVELEMATTTEGYTLPELVDAPGFRYEVLDGEAEVLPGVFVVPTPGHTPGHQSVVVRRRDGTVVVAGQSHETAMEYGTEVLARRAAGEDAHAMADLRLGPEWVARLQSFDPARVVFAHDRSVFEP